MTVGCIYGTTSERPEDLTTTVEVDMGNSTPTGEAVRFTGHVTLNANGHNVTLQDVALLFVAENGSTIRTITDGQLSSENGVHWTETDRERFNVSVSTPPIQLRLRIGTVEKSDNTPFAVYGKRLEDRDNLSYVPFSQNEY
jgi:hypothetical protein